MVLLDVWLSSFSCLSRKVASKHFLFRVRQSVLGMFLKNLLAEFKMGLNSWIDIQVWEKSG